MRIHCTKAEIDVTSLEPFNARTKPQVESTADLYRPQTRLSWVLWAPWWIFPVLFAIFVDGVLRLVFTSDGVVVGVVIRRVEWYDLVKIKPTESEPEHWFCLYMTPSLMIKWKLHCRSHKQKRKNKPMTMFDSWPCDWVGSTASASTPTT